LRFIATGAQRTKPALRIACVPVADANDVHDADDNEGDDDERDTYDGDDGDDDNYHASFYIHNKQQQCPSLA